MKKEIIQIRLNTEPPLEPGTYTAFIVAEIIGPFGIHPTIGKQDGAPERFTITHAGMGLNIYRKTLGCPTSDFATIEEARRTAIRLAKVEWLDWNYFTTYQSHFQYTLLNAATDSFYDKPAWKEFIQQAQKTKAEFDIYWAEKIEAKN